MTKRLDPWMPNQPLTIRAGRDLDIAFERGPYVPVVEALPAADSSQRGKMVILGTLLTPTVPGYPDPRRPPQSDDELYICLRTASGTFVWRRLI